MAARPELATYGDRAHGASCPRKQSIIAAANELLDEAGLDGLTIRAVLKRTGLARRAFYERFVGKDDLVLAVFDETLAEAAAHFAQEIATLPDPLSKIRYIVIGLLLGAIGNEANAAGLGIRRVSAIVREHMRLAGTRPAELESALRPLLQTIADPISEGIRTGQLRECDPDLQARLIYNLIATTVHPELLEEKEQKLAGERGQWLANEIWEFCRRAIVA
jgi:AcrR family transcriptional regulator